MKGTGYIRKPVDCFDNYLIAGHPDALIFVDEHGVVAPRNCKLGRGYQRPDLGAGAPGRCPTWIVLAELVETQSSRHHRLARNEHKRTESEEHEHEHLHNQQSHSHSHSHSAHSKVHHKRHAIKHHHHHQVKKANDQLVQSLTSFMSTYGDTLGGKESEESLTISVENEATEIEEAYIGLASSAFAIPLELDDSVVESGAVFGPLSSDLEIMTLKRSFFVHRVLLFGSKGDPFATVPTLKAFVAALKSGEAENRFLPIISSEDETPEIISSALEAFYKDAEQAAAIAEALMDDKSDVFRDISYLASDGSAFSTFRVLLQACLEAGHGYFHLGDSSGAAQAILLPDGTFPTHKALQAVLDGFILGKAVPKVGKDDKASVIFLLQRIIDAPAAHA